MYIEKSGFNKINNNKIERNNDDGIGLVLTFNNQINYNNLVDNTDHQIEGFLCLDDARNNYWGHDPIRWFFNKECDIYTPLGFVAIHPYLKDPFE